MIRVTEFILVGPITAAMAWWHSRLIKAGRPIQHGWWAAVFSIFLLAGVVWQWSRFDTLSQLGAFVFACLIGRLVVFNISLNLFRGLAMSYISANTTSIIDKIERRLFGTRVWLMEVILGLIFTTLQFFL